MSTPDIKAGVRRIVGTSSSDDEIRSRLRDELGYPYTAAICSRIPTDEVGRQARVIVRGLGGLVRADGAMVMIMMHGPDGKTISV